MSIAASELLASIEGGTPPAILDVRSRWEFCRGHVPGALHIPFWMLPARLAELSWSRDEPVVVYCGHGPRAWFAGRVLRARGFQRVVYLEGHMSKWKKARLPTTRAQWACPSYPNKRRGGRL